MSPRRGDVMVDMEQGFPVALEEEPAPDSAFPAKGQLVEEVGQQVMPEPAPEPEPSSITEDPAIIPVNVSMFAKDASEPATLVETGESYWEVSAPGTNGISDTVWHTIFIQNKSKYDYTVKPKGRTNWDIVKEGRKIKAIFQSEQAKAKDILSRKKQGKYAIQMASLEEENFLKAVDILRMLINDGYYAYIYKTEKKYKGKYWYRIRVGFFKTAEEAQSLGQEIYFRYRDQKIFPDNFWAVMPTSRELSKELIDLRQPINKPWMVELPHYLLKKQAIGDLPIFSSRTDFVHISQKMNPETGQVIYRTRIGFFETEAEAQNKLKRLSRANPIFSKARVVQL